MSISGTDRASPRAALAWLLAGAACGTAGFVYTRFGHGVHSFFMDCLFLWPLAGAFCHGSLYLLGIWPSRAAANAAGAGLATLTAGSFFKGVLEIAGTSSPYEAGFFAVGGVLFAAGIALQLAACVRRGRGRPPLP